MKIAGTIAIVALVFLGITASIGAIPMLIDPTGRLMKMPLSLLEHSPFHSFLIPAAILLCANGALSLAVTALVLRRTRGYALWVAFQGFVLAGWITVEVLMFRHVIWAHYVYWANAAVLIVAGLMMARMSRVASKAS